MSQTMQPIAASPPALPPIGIPPLRQGDHLSIAEFERRYWAMPPETKAELIEGVVFMSSPVSLSGHGEPHFDLMSVFGLYVLNTPNVRGADNATIRELLGINQPQPDALLRIVPECGGRSRVDASGYLIGAPELVGEITFSTASYDLHEKMEVYRKNGVQEYIVWRVEDLAIDWFVLRRQIRTPGQDPGRRLPESSVSRFVAGCGRADQS